MQDWQKTLIRPEATLHEGIAAIDAAGVHIALIVDGDGVLLGVLSDGDVRRGLLQGITLDVPVTRLMNPRPTVIGPDDDREAVLALMRRKSRHQIPLLDVHGRVVGLEVLADLLRPERTNPVVLMVGGLGTRLRPLTDDTPKPLLHVGSKPLLETILESFIAQGFSQFYFSVNYKARLVEEHFGDGARWFVNIDYLYEDAPRGTAGALSLLPASLAEPLVVMNGDLLTNLSFTQLLDFHLERKSLATMCVRTYDVQIPFGVVETEGHRIVGLREKPAHQYLINAGVYALDPKVLSLIPREGRFDMPDLFERLMRDGLPTLVFPVREYWLDIGRHDDLLRAADDMGQVFP